MSLTPSPDAVPTPAAAGVLAAPVAAPIAAPIAEIRGRSLLLGFTGLIPLALSVPILVLRLYAFGIILGLVSGAVVISFHLSRGQGITSVDLLTICFGAVNAVLYFGFGNRTVIQNLDVAIYTLLTALVVISLARRQPWTAQFARRMVAPEFWDRPAFHVINMRISAIWAVAFGGCDLLALLASGALRRYVPIALLFATAMLVPRLARRYRDRFMAAAGAAAAPLAAATEPATPPRPGS